MYIIYIEIVMRKYSSLTAGTSMWWAIVSSHLHWHINNENHNKMKTIDIIVQEYGSINLLGHEIYALALMNLSALWYSL